MIYCRMIRLLAHTLPPLPSASCLSFSVFLAVCRRKSLLTREGRGYARSQTIQRESRALYKSFNTLWLLLFRKLWVHADPKCLGWELASSEVVEGTTTRSISKIFVNF